MLLLVLRYALYDKRWVKCNTCASVKQFIHTNTCDVAKIIDALRQDKKQCVCIRVSSQYKISRGLVATLCSLKGSRIICARTNVKWNKQPFFNIATEVTLYLFTVFDALKVIQCITLVSFFFETSISSLWGWNLYFFTFQETLGSHLKLEFFLVHQLTL